MVGEREKETEREKERKLELIDKLVKVEMRLHISSDSPFQVNFEQMLAKNVLF
jgi:hypothetical protein